MMRLVDRNVSFPRGLGKRENREGLNLGWPKRTNPLGPTGTVVRFEEERGPKDSWKRVILTPTRTPGVGIEVAVI